jgi:peptide-methionine (R)-S-oxide reductase
MTQIPETESGWREKLTPEQYEVLRQAGTERPFTGKYWDAKTEGTYRCAGCGEELFSSDTKFESGTGWPSFFGALAPERIAEVKDRSHGMVRTEVQCANCGGHLGHLFDDGPNPTGLRYCLNSAALDLEPADEAGADRDSI